VKKGRISPRRASYVKFNGKLAQQQLKALGSLQSFEESADWALLCDDSGLHISVFK